MKKLKKGDRVGLKLTSKYSANSPTTFSDLVNGVVNSTEKDSQGVDIVDVDWDEYGRTTMVRADLLEKLETRRFDLEEIIELKTITKEKVPAKVISYTDDRNIFLLQLSDLTVILAHKDFMKSKKAWRPPLLIWT